MIKRNDIKLLSADWSDSDSLISDFIKFLRKEGYRVYTDPSLKDTDIEGYVISKTKLSQSQLRDRVSQKLGFKNWKDFKNKTYSKW